MSKKLLLSAVFGLTLAQAAGADVTHALNALASVFGASPAPRGQYGVTDSGDTCVLTVHMLVTQPAALAGVKMEIADATGVANFIGYQYPLPTLPFIAPAPTLTSGRLTKAGAIELEGTRSDLPLGHTVVRQKMTVTQSPGTVRVQIDDGADLNCRVSLR